MQAINIYTSSFHLTMNGLIRDERSKFNYRTARKKEEIRSALIHSVMCASGLRKTPIVNIPMSYRGGTYKSDKQQLEYLKAAANQGVIKLDGFISTSIEKDSSFQYKKISLFLIN